MMVGRIQLTSPNVCCEQVFTILSPNSLQNIKNVQRLKSILSQNPFAVLFVLLFLFLLFVLHITNQKPDVYKHDALLYEQHNLHDEHTSKFHYGVVIDCGSSGSRIYIYYWPPHTGDKEELLNIKQMIDVDGKPARLKIKPGISSYADNAKNASKSLQSLLQFASDHVPHTKHLETPLYILATAGMRLLENHKQQAILDDLRKNVPKMSKFYFTDSHLDVITGKQEGIYLWIATNYILGRFDHSHDVNTTPASLIAHVSRKQTVGTIEIGGASLQIAYEVPQNASVPPELGATINLGCDVHETIHEYRIYVSTFLGYGTDLARKTYVQGLFSENIASIRSHESVLDPCLPKDLVDEQLLNETNFKITGTGEFARCANLLKSRIEVAGNHCPKPPCSLDGIYQAPIQHSHAEFYGFAEFWYSSNDVLHVGGKYSYDTLVTAAKRFCGTHWSMNKRHYAMGLYPRADDFRFRYQCFKSAWVTSVLHTGLKFPEDFDGLTTVQMIDGKEVQWTLGALLYRTRFLPLRDMKVENIQSAKPAHHGLWIIPHLGFYPIILLCCIIAIVFIIIYCRRIRKFTRSSVFYTMRNESSNYKVLTNKYGMAYDVRVEM